MAELAKRFAPPGMELTEAMVAGFWDWAQLIRCPKT